MISVLTLIEIFYDHVCNMSMEGHIRGNGRDADLPRQTSSSKKSKLVLQDSITRVHIYTWRTVTLILRQHTTAQ